jgi:hypothetical protein
LDEFVARNAGRGKKARGGLQATGLGVFPSFIAAIFINDVLVANMASYGISSSMILVIHDNMINGTNHIV